MDFHLLARDGATLAENPSGSRSPAAKPQASPDQFLLSTPAQGCAQPPRPRRGSRVILADKGYVGKAALDHAAQWETGRLGAEGSGRPRLSLLPWVIALFFHPP